MGRIVINQTDAKQVVILSSDDAEIQGGYYDANGEWHKLGAGDWTTAGFVEGTEPSGDVIYNGSELIRAGCFWNNNSITSFTAPNSWGISENGFINAKNLKSIYLGGTPSSNVNSLGAYAVRYCSSLEELRIPHSKGSFGFGGYGLQGCSSLKLIELGEHGDNLTFPGLPTGTPLETLIIRGNVARSIATNSLDASSYFKQGGLGGKLYVPQSLIETYKTTAGWSTYYDYGTMQILPIEGSEYEL